MKIPQDVVVQADPSGNWVFCNIFSREALAVSSDVFGVLSSVQKKNFKEVQKQYSGVRFLVWEIGHFPNTKGLLADPTPWIRDSSAWPTALSVGIDELISLLEKNHLLISDEKQYRKLFGRKMSLLDTEHFGNFHEQLGQKLILEERKDPAEWWVHQKFSRDYRELNETLYKAVQGYFLDRFFKKKFTKKQTVVDLGCGTGFYAKKMAKYAGTVIGVDPSEKYINIAKKGASQNAQFKVAAVGDSGSLDFIPTGSVDAVFMSDALLFYFVSPDPRFNPNIQTLFAEVKRILKPGGRFYSLEPHGIFWLRPWLGEEDRPFTILTEYCEKQFKVTPNMSELLRAYLKAGFVLKDLHELAPDPSYAKKDKRAYAFAKEFPLWWFFELGV